MNMIEFNPFVRVVGRRPDFYTGPFDSCAYDYRMIYIEKGSAQMCINGEPQPLSENELVIIPPGVPYRRTDDTPNMAYVFNFDLRFENTDAEDLRAHPQKYFDASKILSKTIWDLFPLVLHCAENAAEQIEKILNIFIDEQEFYLERIAAILKTVVIDAIVCTNQDRTPPLVRSIKRYIEENFSQNITNRDIGDFFSYHPNYVSRIFKESTGETLHSYIIGVKLKNALRMILESDLKVTEISRKCGFSSYSYFIKCFREKYGASPLKYRNMRRKSV